MKNAFTAPAKGIDLGRTKSAEQMKKDATRVNPESNAAKSYQTNSEKAPR
jgi:hypothetical protein